MGYVLLAGRQLVRMNADMHHGVWRKPQLRALGEQTLGIVGVGNCGRAVARRAAAFGMRLLGTDIVDIDPLVKETTGLEQVSLHTLLREADIVSFNCTLNPSDVFEVEPLPASSLLRAIPNCWLSPHNANSSVAAAERVHERTLQSLLDAL